MIGNLIVILLGIYKNIILIIGNRGFARTNKHSISTSYQYHIVSLNKHLFNVYIKTCKKIENDFWM